MKKTSFKCTVPGDSLLPIVRSTTEATDPASQLWINPCTAQRNPHRHRSPRSRCFLDARSTMQDLRTWPNSWPCTQLPDFRTFLCRRATAQVFRSVMLSEAHSTHLGVFLSLRPRIPACVVKRLRYPLHERPGLETARIKKNSQDAHKP